MKLSEGGIGIALVFLLGAFGCSDTPTGNDDDFLPIFSNTWHNVLDASHTFALASADDGQPSGTFSGTETRQGVESDIFGTFEHSTCDFSIARASGTVTFSGKFLHADTLRLTRTGETLLIARNQ